MNPGYPPYPSQQMPTPGQYPLYPPTTTSSGMPSPFPTQPGFNAGYPPQSTPSYQPQPPTGYPAQPSAAGYPPTSGYPPQPAYPSQTPAYPQQTPSYPPQMSAYPSQGSYPPSSASSYPPQVCPAPNSFPPHSVPAATPAYPTQPISSGYPTQTSSYPTTAGYGNQTCPAQPYPQQSAAHNAPYTAGAGAMQQERPTPTVVPASPFDPRADAEILRKAMKGFGTDEKTIINVLTKRSNRQRVEIAFNFKSMYGKDLIADLKSELGGKFEDIIVAMMTPLPEFLAQEIRHAIQGIGTNEETLVEILCTASNAEINAIKDAYRRVFGNSLENDLANDTSGHFKRLLISLVQGRRNENYMVDEAAAARDAQALMSAGVMMIGTDESTFNAILCTRSYPQLRRVIMEYQRLTGKPLESAIKSEFSGDIETGLLAIIRSVEDKPGFFAERIRDAVACAGTKDRQLIRIVVSRCEVDMQSIKRSYQQRYGKSMEQAIADDTSGDYKKTLLALISGY